MDIFKTNFLDAEHKNKSM